MILAVPILIYAYAEGPPAGVTGVPGEFGTALIVIRREVARAASHSLVLGHSDRNREINQRFPGNSLLRRCADPWLAPSKKAEAQPTTPAILFTTSVSPS